MVIVIVVNQAVALQILKLTLYFKSSRFLYMTKNSIQKPKYLENEKSLIFHIFKGLSLKQIKHFTLEIESLTFRL